MLQVIGPRCLISDIIPDASTTVSKLVCEVRAQSRLPWMSVMHNQSFAAAQLNKVPSKRLWVCCSVHHAHVCDGEGSAVLLHDRQVTCAALSGGCLEASNKQESNRAVYAWFDCFCHHMDRFELDKTCCASAVGVCVWLGRDRCKNGADCSIQY